MENLLDPVVEIDAALTEMERRKTWEELYKASPEAVEASRTAWYTIPRAKQSSFKESSMPRGDYRRLKRSHLTLPFKMMDLALSGGEFLHMDLDALAERAEARVQWEEQSARRSRLLKGEAEKRPNLYAALGKGIPNVYRLAKLTPDEEKVVTAMADLEILGGEIVPGVTDKILADAIGFHGRLDSMREKRRRAAAKLIALGKEEA